MQESSGRAALIRRDGGALSARRIFDTPDLAERVPTWPAATLHGIVEACGLEACGPLLALATPAQVARVLDLDLWRRPEAGLDERFDAERFGVWLEVLVEHGVEVAARIIASLDADLVAAGLAQHVRIFHIATVNGYETTDGTEIPAVIEPDGGLVCEIDGNRIIARRPDAWDAIVALLVELGASHPAAFSGLMHGCRALSNSRAEVDGLDDLLTDANQVLFDLADGRGQRQERLGYATPASARAFLEASRRLRRDTATAPAIRVTVPPPTPAVPLEPGSRGAAFHAQLRAVLDRDAAIHAVRQQELGWLANALMAGCTIAGRAFTPQEASNAVVATCNLGLEFWPGSRAGASLPDDFLVGQDLLPVFQVGWTVLYDEVCSCAVAGVIDALGALPPRDGETQAALAALRGTLMRQWRAGTPWQAGDALDVLASLDLPAFVTLLALIAECPVLPATIDPASPARRHRLDASAFTFIAERGQIAAVQAFVRALPGLLRG